MPDDALGEADGQYRAPITDHLVAMDGRLAGVNEKVQQLMRLLGAFTIAWLPRTRQPQLAVLHDWHPVARGEVTSITEEVTLHICSSTDGIIWRLESRRQPHIPVERVYRYS